MNALTHGTRAHMLEDLNSAIGKLNMVRDTLDNVSTGVFPATPPPLEVQAKDFARLLRRAIADLPIASDMSEALRENADVLESNPEDTVEVLWRPQK